MADHLQSLVGVTKLLFLSILFKYSFAVSHNDQNSDRRAYKLNDNAQSKMPHNVYRQIADDLSIAMSHDSSRSSLNEDFYTPINNSTIDKKTIYLSFINDVHKENTALALRKLEMKQFQAKHPPERFRVMDRFQHAITKGDLPLYERPPNEMKVPNSYWSHIKGNLFNGSFVEIGNCYTAYLAAESTPNIPVLAYTTKARSAYCMTKSQLSQLENFFIGQHDPDRLSETFKLLYEDSQVLFGNLLLSRLITLTRNLLPHEFEERLARVLSLAFVTFVVEPATDKDTEGGFFKSQWPVFSTLLEKSCEIAGLNCEISKLSSYAGSWVADDVKIYKVAVRNGVRNLPPSFCEKIHNNQKCSLLFSASAASYSSIVFSDNVNISAPASINWFSLSTILELNPFPFTMNHLFLRLIGEAYNGTRSPKQLLVTYNGMMVAPKFKLASESDDEDKHIQNQAHELKRLNKNEKTFNKERIYNDNLDKKSLSQDRVSVERQVLDEDSTQNAHIEKDQSEIDSWERQWQRESHPGPPSAKKDSDELESVNALVNREVVRREEQDKQQSDEGKFVDDTELSKDEKDLKQAMGFLYGHHESIEIVEGKDSQISNSQILSSEIKNNINQMQIQKPNMIIAPDRSKKNFEKLVRKEATERTPNLVNKFEKKSPETDTQYQVPAPVVKKSINVAAEVKNKANTLSMVDRHRSPHHSSQKKVVKKVPRSGKKKKVKSHKRIMPPPAQDVTEEARKRDKYRSDRNPSSRQLLSAEKSLTNEFNDRLLRFKANVFDSREAKKQPAIPNTEHELTGKENLNTTEKAKEEAVTRKNRKLTTEVMTEPTVQPTEKNSQLHWQPHFFTPKMKEEGLYDYHWDLICSDLRATAQSDSHFTVLTFGNLQQSLIGSKIAMLYPQASVVSVMPYSYQQQEDQHRKTMNILPFSNYLLLQNEMGVRVINSLNSFPELMTFQVLGIEIFQPVLALGPGYLYYLGQLLTLARTTYIQLPDPAQLLLAQRLFTKKYSNYSILYTGFISDALRLVGATAHSIAVLGGSVDELHSHRLLKIHLKTLHRKVTVNCSSASEAALHLEPDGTSFVEIRGSQKQFKPARIGEGVGLEFLLELGVFNDERSLLFSEYLSLFVHHDMCPTHVVWFNQTLVYQPINSPYPALNIDVMAQRSAQNQVMTGLLISQVGDEPFSFMDYNSRDGQIIHSLSRIFKNSTFISLLEDKKHAQKLYAATQDKHTDNLAISVMKIKQDFTRKLLKSPDILRYQYMGLSELLDLLFTYSRQAVNQMLGEILATGVTSFIQVPSAEMLSLAMSTFYPEAVHTVMPEDISDEKRFLSANHPLHLYRNAEVRLISESAKADVSINISAKALSPPLAANDARYPWKLLRLDVRNLTIKVDHHFDYKLDGHTRKYTQHCLSYNSSHYEVYLIRDLDGFKIPYGNVHAISLIALLRMGLMDEIKTRFYDLFLNLPFYEDMAPWNIVFRGGKLDYIDYDSKDVTFNKMVPAAYQVMAMMMNYERTITDFGRCKEKANTQYGFSFIAHCVKSDYDGPCLDSRYPVPCGDHTCRSTYIECLQVLSDLEKIKTENNAHSISENSGYQNSAEQMPLVDQWSYDRMGPLKERTVS